jgi:hypothetical protein
VAPHARKRAAFHKHGGADARAIVDGEFFDVEDNARIGGHLISIYPLRV